jgi:hypothetical protein
VLFIISFNRTFGYSSEVSGARARHADLSAGSPVPGFAAPPLPAQPDAAPGVARVRLMINNQGRETPTCLQVLQPHPLASGAQT